MLTGVITAMGVAEPMVLGSARVCAGEDCATLLAGASAAGACWWKASLGARVDRAWSPWMAIGPTGWSLGAGMAWCCAREPG